jgi:hypothetical protein
LALLLVRHRRGRSSAADQLDRHRGAG